MKTALIMYNTFPKVHILSVTFSPQGKEMHFQDHPHSRPLKKNSSHAESWNVRYLHHLGEEDCSSKCWWGLKQIETHMCVCARVFVCEWIASPWFFMSTEAHRLRLQWKWWQALLYFESEWNRMCKEVICTETKHYFLPCANCGSPQGQWADAVQPQWCSTHPESAQGFPKITGT